MRGFCEAIDSSQAVIGDTNSFPASWLSPIATSASSVSSSSPLTSQYRAWVSSSMPRKDQRLGVEPLAFERFAPFSACEAIGLVRSTPFLIFRCPLSAPAPRTVT